MYSSRPGLLFGFHGCEQSVRDNIVSGRAILKPSINGYDWLGVGSIQLEPFDSVRSLFVEGEELYPGAGFHEKNHIQICIRNPNCIKSFFVPRVEVTWKG